MQLGFIVNADSDLRDSVNFAVEQKIGFMELQFDWKEDAPPNLDAGRIRDALRGTTVGIAACGLWWLNTMSADKAEFERNDKIVREFIDMTAAVGGRVVFLNAGEYKADDTDANIAKLKETWPRYRDYATQKGLIIACYLSHKGNFINSPEILERVLREIPDFNIKVDPVGVIRNMKADPYEVIQRFGHRIVHFHMKDIYKGVDGFEIEPPVGMGQLRWNEIMGMLYHHAYNGFIIIEPHAAMWGVGENRFRHVVLSKQYIEGFLL
ncbi:sugar phosphate isomerase/epimerase [Ruminococcaceae bacterium OttesenSCG-928-L11]|nr:sugar phosphate isomerase/epimerase [Ruminococcaceae bacterium OttesenSCG-928-L11]